MGNIFYCNFFWKNKKVKVAEINCPYCNKKIVNSFKLDSLLKCICGKTFKIIEINEDITN